MTEQEKNGTGWIILPKRIGLWAFLSLVVTLLTGVAVAARHAGTLENRLDKVEERQTTNKETNEKILKILCEWCLNFHHDPKKCLPMCRPETKKKDGNK